MATKTKLTLSFLINRFVGRPNLAEKSRSYYYTILRHLQWFAQTHDWPGVEDITREHIRSFLDYVITEPKRWPASERMSFKKASPATIHHYGRVIKSFFTWAEDEEYLVESPTQRFKPEPPHYKLVEPYRDEEITAMLQVCEDDVHLWCPYLGIRNKAIISVFVATGLRVHELSKIKMSEFDAALQQVSVLGKGNKTRVVPVNGEARKALKRYLQVRPPGGDCLWKTDDGTPMAMQSVKVMIVRLKRRAGVVSGGGAHRFRHYFATRYLEGGGDLNSLRLLLGHSSLDMVLKYSQYIDTQRVGRPTSNLIRWTSSIAGRITTRTGTRMLLTFYPSRVCGGVATTGNSDRLCGDAVMPGRAVKHLAALPCYIKTLDHQRYAEK